MNLNRKSQSAPVSRSNSSSKLTLQTNSQKKIEEQKRFVLFDEEKENYGFCHHCKQMKSKYLLASCNYDSLKMGPTVPSSYCIKDVKIYNIDISNRSSIQYLLNLHKSNKYAIVGGVHTPYVLQDQSFITGQKATKKNRKKKSRSRYFQLSESSSKKGQKQNKSELSYTCPRKFCSFCLKTNYEENFGHCYHSQTWVCPFCQGVCFCTRCLRQDTLTQLKAYFIALGGDLDSLRTSNSIFDKVIYENFQVHLQLTLLTNPELKDKYKQNNELKSFQNFGIPNQQLLLDSEKYQIEQQLSKKYSNEVLNQLYEEDQQMMMKISKDKVLAKNGTSQIKQKTESIQSNKRCSQEDQLGKLQIYLEKQLEEEERTLIESKKLQITVERAIRNQDQRIIDQMKKQRGRKQFTLKDFPFSPVPLPLETKQQNQKNDIELKKREDQSQKSEQELLNDLKDSIEEILKKEKIDEKILIPQKRIKKERRRKGTHYTNSKFKKKKRQMKLRLKQMKALASQIQTTNRIQF